MNRIIANRRCLNYILIFGLLIAVLFVGLNNQVLAEDNVNANSEVDKQVAENKQEDKKDEVYIQDRIKALAITYGSTREKGILASIKRFFVGSKPLVEFNKPFGVAVDESTGKIYVTDAVKNEIMVFKADGTYLEKIGVERLKNPTGIDIINDKIYVSNSTKHKITVFDTKGKYIKDFGHIEDEEDFRRLKRPTGLAIDEKRKLVYVADTKGHNLQVYNLEGELLEVMGMRGSGSGYLNYPIAVAVDQKGQIYVGDTLNYRIQVLNPDGKVVRQIDGGPDQKLGSLPRAKGIAIDNQGRTYVTDGYLQVVQIFDQEGKLLSFFGRPGMNDKQFRLPAEIEIDNEGKIYIVDTMNRRLQVLKLKPPKKEKDKSKQDKMTEQNKKSNNKGK